MVVGCYDLRVFFYSDKRRKRSVESTATKVQGKEAEYPLKRGMSLLIDFVWLVSEL